MDRPSDPASPAGVPSTICPMPWINLSLDVDGSSRPCCKFAHRSPDSPYPLANLADTDLEGVWNGPAMQQLRTDFLAGERPADCSTCWDEEAVGITSWRQSFLRDRRVDPPVDYHDITPPQPTALDLKLSNACNLKCRICGPVASSSWLVEEIKHHESGAVVDDLKANKRWYLSNKITQQQANADTFRHWLPRLEHVEMTGGEPMFSVENREVVELIATEGDPQRVSLLLTTNCTVIDDRVMALLPRFGSVTVTLSLDDIGRRLEYERAPSDWATVQANMARYEALCDASDSIELMVNCSVGILNLATLPEVARWFTARGGPLARKFHLNLVHGPDHYRIQNLPDPLKDRVRPGLLDAIADPTLSDTLRSELEGVREFMDASPADLDAWWAFVAVTRRRDQIRGEDFATVFPEFHRHIVDLDLWDPPETMASRAGTAVRWLGRRVRVLR